MRLGSKRWHRARRSKWRRGCRIARRFLQTPELPVLEVNVAPYNRAVRWLNRRLYRTKDAEALCEGIVECPKCHKALPMMALAEEWQRAAHGRQRRWSVTGYGCATVTCCGLLIADNFGRLETYDLEAKPPANPSGGRHEEAYRYQVSLRWSGPALRDARRNWDLFEEYQEDLRAILIVYRADRYATDLDGKSHNPEGTLTAWLWKCGHAHPWIIDFCEHYQRCHLRRGLIAYCTQFLREMESASRSEPHPELFSNSEQ